LRQLLFDANPLASNSKSGVGFLTQRLIEALADVAPTELELTGHYFNFLGRKDIMDSLPSRPNLRYQTTTLVPTKLLNGLRRIGIELPFSLFARTSADIVLFPNFVSMPTRKNILHVLAVHDLSFVDCPQYVSERNASYLRRWVPISIRRANIVLTISEFTKSRIMNEYGVPAENIHVMAVPPATKAAADTSVHAKHHIDMPYMLFVGTLEPRKNIETLISAYEKLPDAIRQKYALVLVGGKGWKDESIHAKIAELQASGHNVIWTGYATEAEKSALYEKATLCIQPSHYEGFGMPILEAMSYGKPVLCSDIEVFHEVASDAAAYFATEDPDDLATKITQIIDDPARLADLSAKASTRAMAVPDWPAVASALYARITN
jgi:glycosyltransferase involved in cell wall biosynthesis